MSRNLCGKTILNESILSIDPDTILRRIHALGIPELATVRSLNLLNGDYINLECRLPNGVTAKLLDDNRTYYANQVEKKDGNRYYGVAADEQQIAVYEYGSGGTDAALVAWVSYQPGYRISPSVS